MNDEHDIDPAQDRIDARRYRWLRTVVVTQDNAAMEALELANIQPKTVPEFDNAVDQARASLAGTVN